jgi:hypothetical protein
MNDDFVAEILRATGAMRTGDPSGATDIIQAALAAGGLTGPAAPRAHNSRTPVSDGLGRRRATTRPTSRARS